MPPGLWPAMEILTQSELRMRYPEVLDKIKSGAVFIHPTDTIYGLGCNALDAKAVEKIRKLKEQFTKPFSIWVPSIEWIRKNCVVDSKGEEWLAKLPGPYTLILKLKNKNSVSNPVVLRGNTLGVRYPYHWFKKVIGDLDFPIITTSANKTSQTFMMTIENLDADIQKEVEFMIYEGEKNGRPSKIINLVEGSVKER